MGELVSLFVLVQQYVSVDSWGIQGVEHQTPGQREKWDAQGLWKA